MKHNSRSQKHGFTLIEILVVMVIIGILVGILLPNLMGMRGRARDTRVKSELAQLRTALQVYYSDFQGFPAAGSAAPNVGAIMGCSTGGTAACTWGGKFSATIDGTERIYMELLPDVLAPGGAITYYQPVDNQSYLIAVTMENASDSDIEASVARCDPSPAIVAANAPFAPTYYVCP